jgi:hypothetical protein
MAFGPASALRLLLGCSLACVAVPAWALADKTDWFQPFVSNAFTYDTNVLRLPPALTAAEKNALIDNVSKGGSKSDFINRLAAGARVRWYSGPHRVNMNLGVDNNIFVRNPALQNVSTFNDALWNWDVSKALATQFGAEYQQFLGPFGNHVIPRKNMLTYMAYSGKLKYQISPDWRAGAGVRWDEISNSVRDRRRNNVQELSQTVDVVYQNAAGNSAGVEYRRGAGFFPERDPAKFHFNEYDVDSARFIVAYLFSAKTRFDGYVGYLDQAFSQAPRLDFAGGIWRLGVEWLPTEKTSIKVTGWRNLDAYPDVASSYFVEDGVKLLSRWEARRKLEITGEFSWVRGNFLGGGLLDSPEGNLPNRVDDLFAAQVGVLYKPVEYLDAYLLYRHEKRRVNRIFFNYEYDSAGIGVVLRF